MVLPAEPMKRLFLFLSLKLQVVKCFIDFFELFLLDNVKILLLDLNIFSFPINSSFHLAILALKLPEELDLLSFFIL